MRRAPPPFRRAALACCAAGLLQGAALAQDAPGSDPTREAPAAAAAQDAPASAFGLEGELIAELNVDRYNRNSDRRGFHDIYNETKLILTGRLPGGFSLNTTLNYQPVERQILDRGRDFRDEGARVDEAYIAWQQGPLRLYAGKIQPRFGFDNEHIPGLYGDEFTDGYELKEKIGGGIQLSLSELLGTAPALGQHSLRVEAFHADRTALSSSLFIDRFPVQTSTTDPLTGLRTTRTRYTNRNRRASGEPDNTSGYRNLALTLDGEQVALPLGQLAYTLGHSIRRAGQDSVEAGTAATERSLIGGLAWEIPLPGEMTLQPMAEWLRRTNADAIRGMRRNVLTTGVELKRQAISLAYTQGWLRERDEETSKARFRTVSASYELDELAPWLKGVQATVGWRRVNEDATSSEGIGAQLLWKASF